MRLSDIVAQVGNARLIGDDAEVNDVVHRHDEVLPGTMFAAIAGQRHDGHDFIADAVTAGAAAVLVQQATALPIPQLVVPNVRHTLGLVASLVHAQPSRKLSVVGVTGTNGKTTVSAFLEAAFAAHGVGTGVIGTVATRILGESQDATHTTPESTDLQRLFQRMYDRGVDAVAMEVSSHGLDLRRVDGTHFTTAVFTNLSQDHLDYHGDMDRYFAAKQRLFTAGFSDHGVVFVGDEWAARLVREATIPLVTVGFAGDVDITVQPTGPQTAELVGAFPDGEPVARTLTVPIPGRHNLANGALAAVAARSNGVPIGVACAGIAHAPGVPGRLEPVQLGAGIRAFVDFAHTPDAVQAVIAAGRGLVAAHGRVIVVVGCGGERDQAKRGPMGAAATTADIAILTSDNPRSEDPHIILSAVAAGSEAAVNAGASCTLHTEVDRRRAIERAVVAARDGDVIIVAGKGHERTQMFADHSIPFDDREVLRNAYRTVKGH